MARSTDDSDDRRKRRRKDDPGYEVLPDDDDENVEERPRLKHRRLDEDDDDQPRRRRQRRSPPFAFPTRTILGILCAIATPLCALAALNGTIRFVIELSSGNLAGIGVFVATVIQVILAKLYGQAALVIWQGNADDYDFRICGIASFVVGGIAALPMCFAARSVAFSGHAPSTIAVAWLVAAIISVCLWTGIGLLSFIEAGVFKGGRRRRTR